MTDRRRRRGFALVVSLWTVIGASAVALAVSGVARDAVGAARNRTNQTKAMWLASGCVAAALDILHGTLWPELDTPASVTRAAWDSLDTFAAPSLSLRVQRCWLSLAPAGLMADVNALSAAQLHRFFVASRIDAYRADSLVDALLDWRDADDIPRPNGAERNWYLTAGRTPPRNGPLIATEELRSIRGFGMLPPEELLGVATGRILWPRAARPVLATLPGMTDEALAILETRGRHHLSDLPLLGSFPEMSEAARDTLARATPALVERITSTPETWIVQARHATGTPSIAVQITVHIALADRRLLVLDRVDAP